MLVYCRLLYFRQIYTQSADCQPKDLRLMLFLFLDKMTELDFLSESSEINQFPNKYIQDFLIVRFAYHLGSISKCKVQYGAIINMKPAKNTANKSKTSNQDPFLSQEQAQPQQIYSYLSEQIKQGMSDKYYPSKTSSKFYNNNIFNSTSKYDVPVSDPLKKITTQNSCYNEFYRTHKKFSKPYGDLTKHVDTISRNKQILRRAQCDTSVGLNNSRKSTIERDTKKQSSHFKKTPQTAEFDQPNTKNQSSNHNLFEKTIKSQYQLFRNLLSRQRNNFNQRKSLNNSLNRLIAAESIYQKVNDLLSVNSKVTKSQF